MRKVSSSQRLLCMLLCVFSPGLHIYAQEPVAYNQPAHLPPPLKQADTNGKAEKQGDRKMLLAVLKELNKEKGTYFLFADQELGKTMVNPVQEMKKNVQEILDQVLKGSGLRYKKVSDNTFVILYDNDTKNEGTAFQTALADPLQSIGTGHLQQQLIKGRVTDEQGNGIGGVSITVKGTDRGTTSDGSGAFSIQAQKGEVLLFTSVGFQSQEVTVGSGDMIQVKLLQGNQSLDEVVVTALGIQRESKSLTYSVQKVDNSELTTVRDANFVNSLTGKVAGVTINRSASGIGGSSRVVLRGNKSTRENQPLYVIDGVPMTNFSPAQPGDAWGQSGVGYVGLDGGDGISNLNPEDIESISVLKGASAAALYGSQAANGVILITTKKGKSGAARINVSSALTFDSRMYDQPLQFKYGQTSGTDVPGSDESWGGVVNAPNHVDDFFQTGVTSFNSLTLSGGSDRNQSYFSYSYANNKGIIPESQLSKNNINFRHTANFFDNRLTADVNILYLHQKAHNRPVTGLYDNPLTGLYEFPRGLGFDQYRDSYEIYSSLRNTYTQNWWDVNYDSGWAASEVQQNPYWLVHRNTGDDKVDRLYSNFSLKFKINDWLSLQARGNIDKSINRIELKSYATTSPILTGLNGTYATLRATNTQLYGDLLLTGHKEIAPALDLSATVGTSINDQVLDQTSFGTKAGVDGLRYANKFTLNNILPSAMTVTPKYEHRQVQAVFATAQFNWNSHLYLDLTARNDWSSTFAFTPVENKGYFYYSGGVTAVLSDWLHIGGPVSFSKLRLSYAKVGNDVKVYSTNPPVFTIDNQNGTVSNTKGPMPNTYLEPEDNRSFEIGTEWRFLHDRVGFDLTYYINNNYRQYIETGASAGTTLTTWYLNSGNIRNNGIELSVNATPFKSKAVTWNTTVNYAFNRNKIEKVSKPGVNQTFYQLTAIGNLLYASYIAEGGAWGDIYGRFFQRSDDGAIIVDENGVPQRGTDANSIVGDQSLKYLGNPIPRYTLGWNNSIQIHEVTLGFLIDGRFGGKVMSMTQAVLDQMGVSQATADARDAGGVMINAEDASGAKVTDPIDAKTFYQGVGGNAGISEYYMYDATNIRLRELSLAYRIPVRASWVNNLSVSVVGKNLFFFSKKAPFDPEMSMATNNGLQGIENFGLPTTRSIGFSVRATF